MRIAGLAYPGKKIIAMFKTTNIHGAQLVCADSLQFIKTIPDNSVNLIATDPPYFGVKANAWDNQWDSDADFLGWIDEFLAEFWRILAPNGSLYMFTGSRLASKIELLTRDRFNVLNHIIWAKPSGMWRGCHKESLRAYFPATERILFAEHYGASGYAKGQSGYASKCADLRKNIFSPLIDAFSLARRQLDISAADINSATGKQMCSHWFSYSEHEKRYSDLKLHYEEVKKQYDDLKAQYENLRRPFHVTADVPYTDVWEFPPVQYYPGKHPCEKPAAMMEHIIKSSSRPGDIVADFFMGSGSTIKAALKLGRQAIGIEIEGERYLQTVDEVKKLFE